MNVEKAHRVTLWRKNKEGEMEINFKHSLSDGFGIPAIVVGCPNKKIFNEHEGLDEYGSKVVGINFDECSECQYFDGLDFSQAIICKFMKTKND
jgi:hypothetical protein